MYAIVPRNTPRELTQVQSGLIYLQTELTSGVQGGELSKYREVAKRADDHSCLRLEDSRERSDSWSSGNLPLAAQVPLTLFGGWVGAVAAATAAPIQKSIDVKRSLEGFLPDPCLEVIRSGQISSLQGILNDRNVAVKDFLSFFGGSESDNKVVETFRIMRLPDWNDARMEMYYVRVEADFESTRALWMHEDKVSLEAEYKMRAYSASRAGLQQLASRGSRNVERSIQDWLNSAITG